MIYKEEFDALNVAGIHYVVVGGVATVLHGYARMTIDLDLVIELAADMPARAIEVLTGLGYRPRLPEAAEAFADSGKRAGWAAHRNMVVFSLYHDSDPRRVIDLFIEYPLEPAMLFGNKTSFRIGGVDIPVAGIDELIKMKRATGRPKDEEDADRLQEIRAGDADHDPR